MTTGRHGAPAEAEIDDEPYAAVAETHISVVFFAGERAYKLLKPIRTAFLDHSTVERRAHATAREHELNRRLAPDVYFGVSEVRENGEVTDHLLVMRRLPSSRRLTKLLSTPERDDALRQVARAVAAFHASEPPDERAARMASRDSVRGLWQHNLDEMRSFAGTYLDAAQLAEVEHLARTYLAGREPLFTNRIRRGLARDGHGDLLADDIFCLPDGPRILDCLAFDDDLRVGDVLLDVAFLAMDVERLAGPRIADQLLSWYHEFSDEEHPPTLADHYIAYRALVRSKVSCLRAEQGVESAAEDAARYLDQTLVHLRAGRPVLVLVGGAPGTGKSTVANGVAAALGWTVLSSDELRKDLAGVAHETHAFAAPDEGIYTPAMTERVYTELVRRAETLVALGESVVLDASWTSAAARAHAHDVAAATCTDLVELHCSLDPAIARERVMRRLVTSQSESDATPAIADHLAARMDPWPSAIDIDTSARSDEVIRAALAAIG